MSKIEHYRAVLGDISRSGVYHMPHIDPQPLLEAAGAIGCEVFRIDLAEVRDKGELLTTLGKALDFPDWYGHNLDALADCLNDFAWRPADGYLILLEHCDGIHGRAEGDFVATLEVFEQAAAEWRDQGIPFWCFVDMQADGINWLPDAE